MESIIGRLDHVAIAADDPVAMVAWYQRVLNFTVVAESSPSPGKKAFLIGPNAQGLQRGSMLEIMPRNDNPRQPRASHDPGLSHIAFQVSNFDAALAQLKNATVTFLGDIVQAVGGGRLISFADNEGNMLQIVERV